MLAPLLLWMVGLARAGAEEWSLRDFLQGDWNLERSSAGQTFRAQYSFKEVDGDPARLEGKSHEEGELGPTNEMVVRVLFSDASGRNGQFHDGRRLSGRSSWERRCRASSRIGSTTTTGTASSTSRRARQTPRAYGASPSSRRGRPSRTGGVLVFNDPLCKQGRYRSTLRPPWQMPDHTAPTGRSPFVPQPRIGSGGLPLPKVSRRRRPNFHILEERGYSVTTT